MTQHIAQGILRTPLAGAAGEIASIAAPVPGKVTEIVAKLGGGVNPNGATNFTVYVDGELVGTLVLNPNQGQAILSLDAPVARFATVSIHAPVVPPAGLNPPIYFLFTFEDSQGAIRRGTVSYATPALVNNATHTSVMPLSRSFFAYRVQTSAPARVRLYTRTSYRTADASRPFGTAVAGENGLILDVQTSALNLIYDLPNPVAGSNLEDVVTDDIALSVTNLSGVTQAITVTVTRAPIEGAQTNTGFLLEVDEEDGVAPLSISKLLVAAGDLVGVGNGVARIKTAGDAQLTVEDTLDVPTSIVARKIVVASGDLEELVDGSARIKTASDVIIPTPTIGVRETDSAPNLAGILRLVVAAGDLTDLGGGEVRIKTASDVVLPTTLPPSGAAGGDLSSNYPNPTVSKVAGISPGSPNGVATLDGAGKLLVAQLPAIALVERFSVASQAAMLALTAQPGDFAFRTDLSEVYLLTGADPTVLANWTIWLHPAMPTTLPPSGAAGGDLGTTYPNPTVTGLQGAALPAAVAGGFLKRNAANTGWEEIVYGTAANTVAQGNDARLSDSRAPSGVAGGDLSGTYPNPVVNRLKGRSMGGLPAVSVYISDNFDDNAIDATFWAYRQSSSSGVLEQNGRLEISGTNSSNERGYISTTTFSIDNHWIGAQLIQHGAGNTSLTSILEVSLTFGTSPTSYKYFVQVERNSSGTFSGQISVNCYAFNGSAGVFASTRYAVYDPAVHKYFRIRKAVSTWFYDYSTDGVNWTNMFSTSPTGNGALGTPAKISLFCGTPGATATIWDNLISDIPASDPITGQNYYPLMWDNTNQQFSLIRALGVIPTTPAGTPPSGVPTNIPTGHTLATVELTTPLKLWIYNTATNTWNSQQF